MKAKQGDVIRFYFSPGTGCTEERRDNNTEMVDIVAEYKGELIAISDIGSACYLHRIDGCYSVLGNVNDQAAIEALIENGWTKESIEHVKKVNDE